MKNPLAIIHFHDRHTQKEKEKKNNKSKSKGGGGASFITFSPQQKSVFSRKMKKGNFFLFFVFMFFWGVKWSK